MKRSFYIVIFALLTTLSLGAKAQIIITIAGNGSIGYTGDGLPATSCQFNWPTAVTVDRFGNLFIADLDNNVIREVTSSGFISTAVGNSLIGYTGDGFSAEVAKLNYPTDVKVDLVGNVFIADQYNHVIRKVNTAGVISTFAGNGFEASSGPGGYSGDGGPATAAEFYSPAAIAFDRTGNLYIADIGNSVVRKVNTLGSISAFAGSASAGYSGDAGQATAAKLNNPTGIAVDAVGNVFIADQYNNVVRKVDASGIITTFAGNGYQAGSADHSGGYTGDGGAATAAELWEPSGLAIDSMGNLYISDANNNVIRKVNTSGIITTVAGNSAGAQGYSGDYGLATAAKLNHPQGITFDNKGNLVIADFNNYAIRKVNVATVGIAPVPEKNISIRLILNPNSGVFTVKGSSANVGEKVDVDVMNSQGQIVYRNSLEAQNGNIDAQVNLNENLPDGIYLLHVNCGGETSTSRFVLQK